MKILHVCETIKGGVATWLNTFEDICGDIVESHFVVPADHLNQLRSTASATTFRRDGRSLRSLIKLVKAAIEAEKEFNPDIIWFQSSYSLIPLFYLRASGTDAKIIYCSHGWAQQRYQSRPIKKKIVSILEGGLAGLSDLVVNICRNDKSIADKSKYLGKHVVVENAMPDLDVDPATLPTPYEYTKDKINLLFVGRFERQKGLDILLDALSDASVKNSGLHLHIVGAGVNSNDKFRQDLTNVTTFHSWVSSDDIPRYYAHAHAVVMPSRWEGLPMVLIEALRAGTPVILANVSGMGGLIDDGESGIVVSHLTRNEFSDALSSLSIENLINMRSSARSQYIMRYTSDRFRREILDILFEVLADIPKSRVSGKGSQV